MKNLLFRNFAISSKIASRISLVPKQITSLTDKQTQFSNLLSFAEYSKTKNIKHTLNLLTDSSFALSTSECNEFLSHVHTKDQAAVWLMETYMENNDIEMDCLTFHYLIASATDANRAFLLFFKANILNTELTLSSLISMYRLLGNVTDFDKREQYTRFVNNYVKSKVSKEDRNTLKLLFPSLLDEVKQKDDGTIKKGRKGQINREKLKSIKVKKKKTDDENIGVLMVTIQGNVVE